MRAGRIRAGQIAHVHALEATVVYWCDLAWKARARVAELEAENAALQVSNDRLWARRLELKARIADLEAKNAALKGEAEARWEGIA